MNIRNQNSKAIKAIPTSNIYLIIAILYTISILISIILQFDDNSIILYLIDTFDIYKGIYLIFIIMKYIIKILLGVSIWLIYYDMRQEKNASIGFDIMLAIVIINFVIYCLFSIVNFIVCSFASFSENGGFTDTYLIPFIITVFITFVYYYLLRSLINIIDILKKGSAKKTYFIRAFI